MQTKSMNPNKVRNAPYSNNDIALWSDGEFAVISDVYNGLYNHKPDNYKIILANNKQELQALGIVKSHK